MNNSLLSPTDGGTNNWYYPVAPATSFTKNYLTGPDGNGYVSMTQNNNRPPYTPQKPCGCNSDRPSPPMIKPIPIPPAAQNNNYLNNNTNYPPAK